MTPFATRFRRLTERQRYKTAIVGAWSCGGGCEGPLQQRPQPEPNQDTE